MSDPKSSGYNKTPLCLDFFAPQPDHIRACRRLPSPVVGFSIDCCSGTMEDSTIRQQYRSVRSKFETLKLLSPASDKDDGGDEETHIEDHLARFNLLAGNLGIEARGHGSLDHRLRDGPEARTVVLDLLDALQDAIGRGTYCLSRLTPNLTRSSQLQSSVDKMLPLRSYQALGRHSWKAPSMTCRHLR
jgi:hypothetical protein